MILKNMIKHQEDSFTNHQLRTIEVIGEILLLPFALILELRTGVPIPRMTKNPNHKITANLPLDILMYLMYLFKKMVKLLAKAKRAYAIITQTTHPPTHT